LTCASGAAGRWQPRVAVSAKVLCGAEFDQDMPELDQHMAELDQYMAELNQQMRN
jgi:hypothetical protein